MSDPEPHAEAVGHAVAEHAEAARLRTRERAAAAARRISIRTLFDRISRSTR